MKTYSTVRGTTRKSSARNHCWITSYSINSTPRTDEHIHATMKPNLWTRNWWSRSQTLKIIIQTTYTTRMDWGKSRCLRGRTIWVVKETREFHWATLSYAGGYPKQIHSSVQIDSRSLTLTNLSTPSSSCIERRVWSKLTISSFVPTNTYYPNNKWALRMNLPCETRLVRDRCCQPIIRSIEIVESSVTSAFNHKNNQALNMLLSDSFISLRLLCAV